MAFILAALTVFAVIETGFSLQCYECTASKNALCVHPTPNDTSIITNCPPGILNRFRGTPFTEPIVRQRHDAAERGVSDWHCVKVMSTTTHSSKIRIKRACEPKTLDCNAFELALDLDNMKMDSCGTCETDLCNVASGMTGNVLLMVTSSLWVVYKMLSLTLGRVP